MMFSDAKVYGWGTDTTWTTGVAAGEVGSMDLSADGPFGADKVTFVDVNDFGVAMLTNGKWGLNHS